MMKKNIGFTGMALCLALTLVLSACGGQSAGTQQPAQGSQPEAGAPAADSGETITIKFAHEEAPGSYQDLYVNRFKEVLEEKVGDKVAVDIYTMGQIGSDQDLVQLLQVNGINMSIASPSTTSSIVPEAQVFDLHFLFSDDMNTNAKIMKESKALNEMLGAKYMDQGIKVLAFWTEGYNVWTSNKQLASPADFRGFKVRTMQSPFLISSYKAYGSNPSPMPFSEVYSGLQVKMIDGQENPSYYVKHNNLYEVQDYLTDSRHSLYVTATCANPSFFAGLPADIQQAILDTIEEIRDYSFEMQQELNDTAIDEMLEAKPGLNISELTPEARQEFIELCAPVREEFNNTVGEDGKAILQTLLDEVAAAK